MTTPDNPDSPTCRCGRVMVGSTDTGSRNWNPDCPEHGVDSMYHNSPERIRQREINLQRLIDLQRRAREARRKALSDNTASFDQEGEHR